MRAVISTTYDDLYFFYFPIVEWSWNKLGIPVNCILAPYRNENDTKKLQLACKIIPRNLPEGVNNSLDFFSAPDHKLATYAQCSRLYAAANPSDENEVLITSDIDMAVFSKDYFRQAESGQIHVFGADLVPEGQYPMCYIAMPVKLWQQVMWLTPYIPTQTYLDELLGSIETEHFRGNYWAKDQETIYNQLTKYNWPVVKHYRAHKPYSFATRRADRDGWPQIPTPDIIDAHLPRPGYTEENFAKILSLFQTMYPNEEFGWMVNYRNEYLKLI